MNIKCNRHTISVLVHLLLFDITSWALSAVCGRSMLIEGVLSKGDPYSFKLLLWCFVSRVTACGSDNSIQLTPAVETSQTGQSPILLIAMVTTNYSTGVVLGRCRKVFSLVYSMQNLLMFGFCGIAMVIVHLNSIVHYFNSNGWICCCMYIQHVCMCVLTVYKLCSWSIQWHSSLYSGHLWSSLGQAQVVLIREVSLVQR